MSADYKSINLTRYDANAQRLAASYNSVTTPQSMPVLAAIAEGYKGSGRAALDIGCGSGRDAFWLCGKGWYVIAADGSAEMIREAKKAHSHASLDFIHDTAPDFPAIARMNKTFNLIVMAAFIFHFDAAERITILNNAVRFLKEEGIVHLTLRHGPPSLDRTIFDVSADEITVFAQENSLDFRIHGKQADFMGRGDITWTHVSFWRGQNWDFVKDISLD